MASPLDFLLDPRFQTPGINPNAPDPRQALGGSIAPQNPLDKFLGGKSGSLLMNLLAQQGFSTTPQSPLGALGRGLQQTQAQGIQAGRAGLEDELLRSRIGLTRAQTGAELATAATGGSASNVQTTFKGANGNMHIVLRNGKVKDTDIAFNENVKFFTKDDGSVIGVDSSTGERLGTVISPKEASEARERKTRETAQVQASIELPIALTSLDQTLTSVDASMDTARGALEQVTPGTTGLRGSIAGGIPGSAAFDLRANIKTVQANLGFDRLQKMREASKSGGALGQVSERELDLLVSSINSLDADQSEEQLRANFDRVLKHYDNYKREINIMKVKLQEGAGVTLETTDKPLSEMTDAELKAVIDGG